MHDPFGTASAPQIPASHLAMQNLRDPSLIWTHLGKATVRSAAQEHVLEAGQGIWMPAGTPYTVDVDPDSVTFPIVPAAGNHTATLRQAVRTTLPASWSDWLISQFARSLGYLRDTTADTSPISLLSNSPRALRTMDTGRAQPSLPPLPVSPEAASVGRSLLLAPDDPADTTEHARSVNVSVRTLQQQFLRETKLPFGRWRTAVRVSAAAAMIDAGHGIASAGRKAGFSTPAGFTKAFLAGTGVTPSQYRRGQHRRGQHTTSQQHTDTAASSFPSPTIPATQSWNRINAFHVLLWLCRGSAQVTIGERTRWLRPGDTIWLPAGVRNRVTLSRDSLLLPLGSRTGTLAALVPDRLVQRVLPASEPYLLHTLVANYSLLRPENHDPNWITRRFIAALSPHSTAPNGSSALTTRVRTITQEVHLRPSDQRSLAHWARELGTNRADLGRDFRETMGQSYRAWRSAVRMTAARGYLEGGMGVAETSRKLGYSHPSSFTAVFTRAHGIPPRDYQRYGRHPSKEPLIVR